MESRALVSEVVRRSPLAVSVRFEVPQGFSYLPGQYMFITIGEGRAALMRHLTISSSPTEPFLEVTKGLTGHPFAHALSSLAPGDQVHIRGPYGDFTFSGEYSKVAFISGGIGITPLRSMTRYAIDRGLPTSIKLLYSCRTDEELLFFPELSKLAELHSALELAVTLTRPGPGWTSRVGRIDRDFVGREVADWKERVFYCSGPAGMVEAIAAILREIGVPEDRIRQEYFPGY